MNFDVNKARTTVRRTANTIAAISFAGIGGSYLDVRFSWTRYFLWRLTVGLFFLYLAFVVYSTGDKFRGIGVLLVSGAKMKLTTIASKLRMTAAEMEESPIPEWNQ